MDDAKKVLKINFRLKVYIRDPYYFSHFWEGCLSEFFFKKRTRIQVGYSYSNALQMYKN